MLKWLYQLIRFDPSPCRWRTCVSGLEQLEPRIVLSANVTAVVRGGSLTVSGDNPVMDGSKLGAEVVVRQNGPGSFVVENRNGTLNHSFIVSLISVGSR